MAWETFSLLCILQLVVAATVFRCYVRREYERRGRLGWLGVILETGVFFLYMNLSYAFVPAPWPVLPALPADLWLRYAGLGLVSGGLALLLAGLAQLGLARALGRPANGLRRHGLYTLVRNPQLTGGGVVIVGYALWWPSWQALLWALLYLPLAHVMVVTEEEHLLAVFGDAYRDYCARVPRYLPRLRRR